MLKNCAKSCGQCPKRTRRSAKKEKLSARKLHHDNLLAQTANFGDVQKADGSDSHETLAVVESSIEYMQSDDVRTLTKEYRDLCRNNHELCSFWAAIGKFIAPCLTFGFFMKV